MTKKSLLVWLILMLAVTLPACKGKSGGGGTDLPPDERPPVITPATVGTVFSSADAKPITSFLQSVGNMNNYGEYFPYQANIWDIDLDFDLVNEQFPWAIDLIVGEISFFPDDQTYNELTFYTPTMGTGQGIKIADVSDGSRIDWYVLGIDGLGKSAFINATADSRLQQTIDLTTAPSGTTLTLTWEDEVFLEKGRFPGYTPTYSVVIRSTSGSLLATLFTTTTNASNYYTRDVTAYGGQTIVLSFEERSAPVSGMVTFAEVDSVSIKDVAGNEYVQNGTFEAGILPWTTNTPAQVQNMTSGARSVDGLNVTRSFYTVPNKSWGRWVDLFTNPTGSAITKTITYESALGSGKAGIILRSIPGDSRIRALSSWDSAAGIRDVGLVFGKATTVDYTSATGIGSNDGSDIITVTYDITVPANGSVALVNFVIMNGKYTGLAPGVTAQSRASEIDAEAYSILMKFWTEAQYRDGMSQEQMDAIFNF